MVLQKIKRWLSCLILAAVLAGEATLLADAAFAWCGMAMGRMGFLGCFGGLTLAFVCVPWFTQKSLKVSVVLFPVTIAALAAALFLFWKSFSGNAVYRDVDSGKEQLYAGHRVMAVVPHEDDELNILGGVLEEYLAYGSELYPVFVTNGDYSDSAEVRFAEAMAVAEYLGIPAENVIFLGYGDQWKEGGPHLYNAEPGVVVESYAGRTETYGTEGKSAYREGNAYTVENLMADLQSVILEYCPDVIFCNDYDSHIDHKAVSLTFDKVMGRILKQEPEYRPAVFKGYAYASAWKAEPDFYEVNLLSTDNVFGEPHNQKPELYRWEERVRFPVDAATLSRSIYSSRAYQALALHKSQGAHEQADRIINGDRVFWERRTDSLCYDAGIQTSSGSAELLRDFMLIDSVDLTDEKRLPCDSTWVPESTDTERSIMVTFSGPVDIAEIVLYDNPSGEENILDAVIRFPDGTGLNTGPLDIGGAATRFAVEKKAVTGFELILLETEGETAGLTEIEVFRKQEEPGLHWIKLMDAQGQFAYDYWTESNGTAEFSLYCYGADQEEVTVCCDNPNCVTTLEEGLLTVSCPSGEAAVITVTCSESGVSDSICVSNPSVLKRLQYELGRGLEKFFLQGYLDGCWWNTVTYEVLDIAGYKLKALLP